MLLLFCQPVPIYKILYLELIHEICPRNEDLELYDYQWS